MDGICMLNVIAERTLDIDEELYACFIHWKQEFERLNWIELMKIHK